MKGNVIRLNIMHLNSVQMNSIGEVQSVSLTAGESTEDPVYPPTTYTLAANVSNGKVTATKNGTAISLPYVAAEGDVIVLSVTPDEGYEFKGWLDGNKSNPRTVTMTGNVVLSASCVEIAKPTYTLSASVTNGMVSATRNGSAVNLPFTANEGDVIVVEVTPNDGYEFNGWNDGNTDNPRSITMNADVALSAQCVEVVQPPVGNYIQFEDKAVEAICVANWSSDGIGLTEEDAAAVTDIGTAFKKNTEITSFDEFRYFTGVTYVPTNAFNGCINLSSIDLRNIKKIANSAFYGAGIKSLYAPSLEELEQPNNYTSTFCNSGLQEISSLGSITYIPQGNYSYGCFNGCASLKVVNLPNTLREIRGYAFNNANNVETMNLPQSLTIINSLPRGTWANGATINLPNLISVDQVFAELAIKRVENLGLVTTLSAESGNTEYNGLFRDCTQLEYARIPSTTTSIGVSTFYRCSALQTLICDATTPPSLYPNALSGTHASLVIYVPDASLEAYKTATNWNQYADRIHPLSEIEGSPYIQFADAEVERVLMANGVSSDGIGITKEDAAAVTSLNAMFNSNSAITSFDELRYFTGLTKMSSDTPATYVGEFYNCTNLQRVTIPANVSKVLNYTFYKCTSLQSVTFEDASRITELGQRAFSDTAIGGEIAFPNLEKVDGSLQSMNIERVLDLGKITTIDGIDSGYAGALLSGCKFLTYLCLPATLTALNGFAIGQCPALATIVSLATTPPTLSSAAFSGCGAITAIYVPDASVDAYKTSWSAHASKIKPLSELNA